MDASEKVEYMSFALTRNLTLCTLTRNLTLNISLCLSLLSLSLCSSLLSLHPPPLHAP